MLKGVLQKVINLRSGVLKQRFAPMNPIDIVNRFKESKVEISLDDAKPHQIDDLLNAVDAIIDTSCSTLSPGFMNQLYARNDEYSLAADWLLSALNTNVHTYEVAPSLTLIEHEVIKKIASKIGGEYSLNFDGLVLPGGSLSNIMAMHIAKPKNRTNNVAFISEKAHYSFDKAANMLNVKLVKIRCTSDGKMDIEALIEAFKKEVPYFVGATAGTTVLGAIDNLEAISDICKERGIWMHVDACLGGTLLFSDTHRNVLKGIETADSIAWNPHKMLGITLPCSILMTSHKDHLKVCMATCANYLFKGNPLDIGDKSLMCSRRGDALKLWMFWKAHGDKQIADKIDNIMDLAAYLATQVKNRPNFELIGHNINVVTFLHKPEYSLKVHDLLAIEGKFMISMQSSDDNKVMYRIVICQQEIDRNILNNVLNSIEEKSNS